MPFESIQRRSIFSRSINFGFNDLFTLKSEFKAQSLLFEKGINYILWTELWVGLFTWFMTPNKTDANSHKTWLELSFLIKTSINSSWENFLISILQFPVNVLCTTRFTHSAKQSESMQTIRANQRKMENVCNGILLIFQRLCLLSWRCEFQNSLEERRYLERWKCSDKKICKLGKICRLGDEKMCCILFWNRYLKKRWTLSIF